MPVSLVNDLHVTVRLLCLKIYSLYDNLQKRNKIFNLTERNSVFFQVISLLFSWSSWWHKSNKWEYILRKYLQFLFCSQSKRSMYAYLSPVYQQRYPSKYLLLNVFSRLSDAILYRTPGEECSKSKSLETRWSVYSVSIMHFTALFFQSMKL